MCNPGSLLLGATAVLLAVVSASADDERFLKRIRHHEHGDGRPLTDPGVTRRAQLSDDGVCSCSPRSYEFALNFVNGCSGNPLGGNEGVDGSICFFTMGGSPEDVEDGVAFPGGPPPPPPPPPEEAYRLFPQHFSRSRRRARLLDGIPLFSHWEHAEGVRARRAQGADGLDTVPTVVTSVTFLEFDSDIDDIVNQDSTYFETTLGDGDVMTFSSASAGLDPDTPLSAQGDKLPGGVMLVLFGVNSDNVVVQNTVAWGYVLGGCSREPVAAGDAIGWVRLDGLEAPAAAFCPGVTDPPTPVVFETSAIEPPAEAPAADDVGPKGSGGSKSSKVYVLKQSSKGKSAKAFSSKAGKITVDPVEVKEEAIAKAAKTVDPKADKAAVATKGAKVSKAGEGKSSKTKSGKSAKSSKGTVAATLVQVDSVQADSVEAPAESAPLPAVAMADVGTPFPTVSMVASANSEGDGDGV